jgi:tRNA A22 N-methylase
LTNEGATLKVTLAWSSPIEYSEKNSSLVSEKPGVYEILVKQQGNGGKRRYVGQSDDLRRRFLQHLTDEEPNECVKEYVRKFKTFFRYAQPIAKEDDREDVEKALYDRYKHKCNSPPYGEPPTGSGRNVSIDLTEKPSDEVVPLQ